MNCNKTNYNKDEISFSTFDTVKHDLNFCNTNENGAIKSSNYNQNYPVHKLHKSLVVSSPTGSEKRIIFEFSIVRFLENFPNYVENSKIIYVSSIKATCTEHYKDWKNKFSSHGLKCIEITGDTDFSKDMHLINNNQLIITTLEKWDSLMRKCKDIKYTLCVVKLFLIDEVNLINDVDRGATLETIVSRMKIIPKNTNMNDFTLRFVAVSTTVSNIEDIAKWLCIDQSNPAYYLKINEDERPVKLKKIVLDYKCITSSFKFDLDLTHKLKSLIQQYSNKQSTLIFCGTQKSVEYTCSILVKDTKIIELCEDKKRHIDEISKEVYNKTIKDLVQHGIGCHYAGMTFQEKTCIENLFQNGCLNILVATSTLAMKVNISAQLVIIKSTEYYTFNGYKEYNECQVLQMIGRAGRPQVDTSATVIIMTKQSAKNRYEQILIGNQFLESHLHKHLIEHLNTEIFMGTINNVTVAMDWIQSTFLYIRACKTPQNYGMTKTLNVNEVEHKLQNLCLTSIKSLACTGLINCFDGNNKITSKPEGEIMAKYSISFATMNLYMQLKGTESLNDMLRILTCSKEFEQIKFRRTDKENLNSLNKNQQSSSNNVIRFPIDEGINTRETKINCLLQAILGTLKISNGSLAQDAYKIILISIRLTKALREIAFKGTMFESARSACILAKCISTKLWEQSEYVSKLIPRIGLVLSGLLVSNGKTTLESIRDTDPRELERILKRNAPFGNHILDFITQIPKYRVRASFDKYMKLLILKISLTDFINISKTVRSHTISILVGDSENYLLKAHQICNEEFLKQEGVIDMTVLLKNKCYFHVPDYTVTICLISDQWIGIDIEMKLKLDNSKEYIKESISAEHKKSTEINQHYKRMGQISINENEKKKYATQMNIKNVSSKDEDQDLKVINKLHVEENNIKICHTNENSVATHNVTGKMNIGMKTENNNNGKVNYCFKSNKDYLNKYFSYNELMNDNIFSDLFLPDDNSYIISQKFDLEEKYCFRENAMQTDHWTNNTQIKVIDPIQSQCSRNVFPNEKLENNKFIDLDKYNKIAHKKNSLCIKDILLENKENVNPNKLERLKKPSLRILSSKLFGKPSTQTIRKSDVKSNHSINDSKMTNYNVSSKSILLKKNVSVNAVIDGKSSKTTTQFETSTQNIVAPTSGSTSNLTSGRLTRRIEANLKVTSDFYASHKQISEPASGSGGRTCGENVLKFVCDYSYERTKPDAVGRLSEASGLIAYDHRPSGKVTLDKFFRASKYLRRLKAPNTDKIVSTFDPMKSWMCGDGEKWSSNSVKRIKVKHKPLETSLGDVHKLFVHRFTNRNEYNKDDSEVSNVATITAAQCLRYDLPTSTSQKK